MAKATLTTLGDLADSHPSVFGWCPACKTSQKIDLAVLVDQLGRNWTYVGQWRWPVPCATCGTSLNVQTAGTSTERSEAAPGAEVAARKVLAIAVGTFHTKPGQYFLVDSIQGWWPGEWPMSSMPEGIAFAVSRGWLMWTETVGVLAMTEEGLRQA